MLKLSLQFFAHKKGVGSTKNGRDSESKRLGVKKADGQAAFTSATLDVHDSIAFVDGHPWMGRADQHQRTHLDIDVRVCRQCVLCPGAPPFAEDCPRMPRGALGRPFAKFCKLELLYA